MFSMKASTVKKRRKAQARVAAEQRRTVFRDEEFGIRLERDSPSGGRDRLRVVWQVDAQPFLALMALDRLRKGTLHALEESLVSECRIDGLSWDDIGFFLGISGTAARKRWPGVDAAVEELLAVEAAAQ